MVGVAHMALARGGDDALTVPILGSVRETEKPAPSYGFSGGTDLYCSSSPMTKHHLVTPQIRKISNRCARNKGHAIGRTDTRFRQKPDPQADPVERLQHREKNPERQSHCI